MFGLFLLILFSPFSLPRKRLDDQIAIILDIFGGITIVILSSASQNTVRCEEISILCQIESTDSEGCK